MLRPGRLIGGEPPDVTYAAPGGALGEIVDQVISILANDDGVLRCQHGGRIVVLQGRGIATLEVAPRGAIV